MPQLKPPPPPKPPPRPPPPPPPPARPPPPPPPPAAAPPPAGASRVHLPANASGLPCASTLLLIRSTIAAAPIIAATRRIRLLLHACRRGGLPGRNPLNIPQ